MDFYVILPKNRDYSLTKKSVPMNVEQLNHEIEQHNIMSLIPLEELDDLTLQEISFIYQKFKDFVLATGAVNYDNKEIKILSIIGHYRIRRREDQLLYDVIRQDIEKYESDRYKSDDTKDTMGIKKLFKKFNKKR